MGRGALDKLMYVNIVSLLVINIENFYPLLTLNSWELPYNDWYNKCSNLVEMSEMLRWPMPFYAHLLIIILLQILSKNSEEDVILHLKISNLLCTLNKKAKN